MISPSTYERFDALADALSKVSTVVLSTHVNPDGDGLGSELALASMMRSRGIHATILNHDPVPPPYLFLDPDGTTLRQFDPTRDAETVRSADMIMVVDTNHPDRLGSLAPFVRAHPGRKVIIDHHLEPDAFADLVVTDTGACATGELVYRYLEHTESLPLSRAIATALYTAIMTDTGSFRFPKTDGDVHRIVAALIDGGADPSDIYQQIYDQGGINRLHLLGRVLASLELHHDGQVCVLAVTRDMFSQTGTTESDTDKFVTYGLAIAGVRVALMVSELPDMVKLNVRSKGTVPANDIAKAFGGNGHLNAAGARIPPTPLDTLVREVLDITSTFLNKD